VFLSKRFLVPMSFEMKKRGSDGAVLMDHILEKKNNPVD
jgi:hypothetical protein